MVVSWSDAQVVATVASGAKTGVAQILQGGVWSNQVNLTVVTPTITSLTPTSGVAGTQVTIAGSGFGATQGSGNVWLGSTYGVVVSWSDAQVVATVASGAKTGVAQILGGSVVEPGEPDGGDTDDHPYYADFGSGGNAGNDRGLGVWSDAGQRECVVGEHVRGGGELE